MGAQPHYSPGAIVSARGREWIVLAGSDAETLRVRPLSGTEEDQLLIHVPLEAEPVKEARFPLPSATRQGNHETASLLRDALQLSLRRGAGPFRGFAQIAVEPRAYQLVPLLMALKLDPVRLLIADDVGIGKTIEAALIARELLDRGDVTRTTVLCPPHLVEQWVSELEERFHIRAVAVTAASANRLERDLPMGGSIFHSHPHTVVSLDYIKSERRRAEFLRACPELVIVDEAHTCSTAGRGRHQRFQLLKGLSENAARHLVLLSATPHSGDEGAFYQLLGLLDRAFTRLAEAEGEERKQLREKLAAHFVQRRRPDIAEWHETRLFPRRETAELTYRLTGEWQSFFDATLDYCAGVVEAAGGDERRQRLNFWGTLALMRCAASSPAAAAKALRTRAGLDEGGDDESLVEQVFDGAADQLPEDDVEPGVANADPELQALIAQAEALAGARGDPKLKLLGEHLEKLLKDGFHPVVFCRYIATAHYLGEHLGQRFKDVDLRVVTGELSSAERLERVEELGESEKRLLIATDCLSEGINLQEHFDAVVHYDLSWNPTRHEQREGRVDRFGQKREVVRTTLMYGANNPVDGAVLQVILRKAEKIREELGVPVPLPDDGHSLGQALMKAVLLRKREAAPQMTFDFLALDEAKALEVRWQDAAENAKKNRTVFAQRRLKPEDVLPEWRKSIAAAGGKEDVRRFTERALAYLGAGLEPLRRGFKAPLEALPDDVRDRLDAEGLHGTLLVDFDYPAAPRCRPVQRSHPLVSVLAETLLARTLGAREDEGAEGVRDAGDLGRVGAWVCGEVAQVTTVALLRLRHQLGIQRAQGATTLLVEEAAVFAWQGVSDARYLTGEEAAALLKAPPVGSPPEAVRRRAIAQALQQAEARQVDRDAFAAARAEELLADHRRVREASDARGSYSVTPLLPADVIGLYVLLPKVG